MAITIAPRTRLASTGDPGHIDGPDGIYVHLDVITRITRGSSYKRTETALEKGAALTVHRQRVPQTVTLEIEANNVSPIPGALFVLRWELDHAAKTLERLIAAQASESELRIWTGREFLRTPAGSQVWVLDDMDHMLEGTDSGRLRATLKFGESPRFTTFFTSAIETVDNSLIDVVAGSVDRGRQSTTTVSDSAATDIAENTWP